MGELIPLRRPAPSQPLPPTVNAEALCRLARSLEVGSPGLARTTYEAAIKMDPRNANARVNLGRLLHEAGELALAVAEYRAALEIDPTGATAAFNLGVALEDLARPDEARAAYSRAILAEPGCADAHFNLSRLLERREPRMALRHLVAYRKLVKAR